MKTRFALLLPLVIVTFVSSTAVYAQQISILEEIRKAIEEKGAQWTAGETPFTYYTPEEKKNLCGLILEESHGPWFQPDESRTPPAVFDWRDHLGYDWSTDVRDQAQCGSCWAFGCCAAFEARYGIFRNDPFIQPDFSEQFMVSCSGGSCGGYYHSGTLNFLQSTGTPDELCFPYRADDLPCEDACSDWPDRVFKISDWNFVNGDPEIMMNALLEGPLSVGFTVYDDFMSYTGGVYQHVWGGNPGGHLVAMYGYNSENSPPYWICKNSWGPSWGMDGWFYIAWGECGIESSVGASRMDVHNIVAGRVTDAATGDSIPDARVAILETGQWTLTDEHGIFWLGSLSESATMVMSHFKHYADTSDVIILNDSTTIYNASLEALETATMSGVVHDSVNSQGVHARVVLMMNGAAYDSVMTDAGTGSYEFTDLPISNPPYTVYTGFRVTAPLPYPLSSVFEEEVTLTEGGLTCDLEVPPARIFLVDDDDGETYENYYLPEIEASGVSYVHFDVSARDTSAADYLSMFPPNTMVIWFTGDASHNTVEPEEETLLSAFLGSGGRLFMTGQNIAEDLSGRYSPFLAEILHINYIDTSACKFAKGYNGDPLGRNMETIVTIGAQGASNQTSRDHIEAIDGVAQPCLYYATSPIDEEGEGTAAVWVADQVTEKPNIVFFGFGFEAIISNNVNSCSRDDVLSYVLQLFEMIPVGVEDEQDEPLAGSSIPKAYALQQNYPNPFNPSTTIQFDIPETENGGVPVKIEIYNLRGQLIHCLIDDECEPGTHSVHWDGRNKNGESVTSGVYLYRVVAGKFNSTRKMVLLK